MSTSSPGLITEILNRIKQGDTDAEAELLELVHPALKRIADLLMNRERPGHLMRPSDLLQEAFLRLFPLDKVDWQNRKHFYNTASQIMRHILVDHARREYAGGRIMLPIEEVQGLRINRDEDLVNLNEALIALERIDPELADVVTMQFFGGLKQDEIAEILKISVVTVKRRWKIAKAFLKSEIIDAGQTEKLDEIGSANLL